MEHTIWCNPNDETFVQFINKAKRTFRKMSAISVVANPQEQYVEVKFLAVDGSDAIIRYRMGK